MPLVVLVFGEFSEQEMYSHQLFYGQSNELILVADRDSNEIGKQSPMLKESPL